MFPPKDFDQAALVWPTGQKRSGFFCADNGAKKATLGQKKATPLFSLQFVPMDYLSLIRRLGAIKGYICRHRSFH